MPVKDRATQRREAAEARAAQRIADDQPAHGWEAGQQIVVHVPGKPEPWRFDKIERVSVLTVRTKERDSFRIRTDGTLRRFDSSVLGGNVYAYKLDHPIAQGVMAKIRDNAKLAARRETARTVVNRWIVSGDPDDFYALVTKLGRLQYGETDLVMIGELWKKAKGE